MDRHSNGGQLPEFRIRNLGQSQQLVEKNSNDKERPNDTVQSAKYAGLHLFKMRKASYDKLVMDKPQAVLSYLDVDDGDKITVGSGMELDQRLQETPIVAKRNRPPYVIKDDMHSFDIDPSDEVQNVWSQRSLQENEKTKPGPMPPADFGLEANRLKRALSDRIGRLAAQMKSTTIDDLPNSTNVSEDKSTSAASSSIDPRLHYIQRSQPPMIAAASASAPVSDNNSTAYRRGQTPFSASLALPEPVNVNLESATKSPSQAKGTLTPKGTKMAQQAGAAIGHQPLGFMNNTSPTSSDHAGRWASYGNMNSSFKYPAVELSTSPQTRAAELASDSHDQQQPLLQMFQAELDKIMSRADQTDPSSVSPVAKPPPVHVRNSSRNVESTTSNSTAPSEGVKSSLRILFNGIGDLAAETLGSNPDLAGRLAVAGQGLQSNLDVALKTGAEALRSVSRSADSSSAESDPVSTRERAADGDVISSTSTGDLVWTSRNDDDQHGSRCITQCPRDPSTCPVRSTIRDLAQRIGSTHNNGMHNTSEAQKASSSEQAAKPRSHQSTQTTAKKERHRDDRATFEADKILAKRYIAYNSICGPTKLQYLIRWVGHGSEHDVWYDAENLGGCKGLVDHYDRALQKTVWESQNPPKLSKDELHAIHLRTAGDRMVASRKWDECEEAKDERKLQVDAFKRHYRLHGIAQAGASNTKVLSALLDPTMDGDAEARNKRNTKSLSAMLEPAEEDTARMRGGHKPKTWSAMLEPATDDEAGARSSSLDAVASSTSSSSASHSTLRHRKSWHPTSAAVSFGRPVSPTAAAQEKYPAIANFEAAHHLTKDDRRKSVPTMKSQSSGLDFPNIEEFHSAWLDDSSRDTSPKDKSVRFVQDPWVEKKVAQAAWISKQKEEESLYGVPEDLPSAKKEGKKPARYSSPPPPKSAFSSWSSPNEPDEFRFDKKGMSSGDIWRELATKASVRRAKSLNFSDGRPTSHLSQPPFRGSPLRSVYNEEPKDDKDDAHNSSTMTPISQLAALSGPIRSRREPSGLRRSASARFPHPFEGQTSNGKRDADVSTPRYGLARSHSDARWRLKKAITSSSGPQTRNEDLNVSIGNPPYEGERSAVPNADPWAFLNESPRVAESTALKYPAMTPSKPVPAPIPSIPAVHAPSSAPTPTPAENSFQPETSLSAMNITRGTLPQRMESVPPAVKTRNDAINNAVKSLVSMGYEEAQAKFVAEGANGDMDEALDMLQEDQQARHEGFGNERDERAREAARELLGDRAEEEGKVMRRMPGAF